MNTVIEVGELRTLITDDARYIMLLLTVVQPHSYSGLTRRHAVGLAAAGALAPRPLLPASALDASGPPERQRLLKLISDDADEASILGAVEALNLLDPSEGKAATMPDALAGEWELLWSYGTAKFSPLLALPRPIRPQSVQLLGDQAAAAVGAGRVANLLNLPGLSLVLSSGVAPAQSEPATLEIAPPFRLEVEVPLLRVRKLLVEAGSDAEFRALNARDSEAQAAPRNRYVQSYLETSGSAGDLRVSTVASGDPVIVGTVFVHRRL